MVGVTLAAYAAGIHPSVVQFILAAVITVLANMGSAGLPGAAVVYAADAPGFQFLGAPLGLIPFYIAAIAIPDIFLTTANVTADLTVATLLAGKVTAEQDFRAGIVEAAE
jgi:Na+/H+-dicarboxylate symporter